MALKLKSDKLFKATVKLNDELEKEVTFRLPRVVDIYSSSDGNQLLNTIYTLANMAKPFDKPAAGHSFFTCPHCREILKDLNILSNVEGF